jgi:hypothetical protein
MQTETFERRVRQRDGGIGEPPRRQLETMVLGMYQEMPGLRLHLGQAARLFGLRVATCQIVLDDLVRKGLLRQAPDGQYASGDGNP